MGSNLTKKKSLKRCFKWRPRFLSPDAYGGVRNCSKVDEEIFPSRENESTVVDYKIYESYGCSERVILRRSKSINPDIKIFRRSLEANDARWNSQLQQDENMYGNESRLRRNSVGQGHVIRHKAATEEGQNLILRRKRNSSTLTRHDVKRHSSSLSLHSIGYKVEPGDFPNVQTVKRKCRHFEVSFVRGITSRLNSSEDLFELLAVGISNEAQDSFVSLADCLNMKNDTKALSDRVQPIIPAKQFHELAHLLLAPDRQDVSLLSTHAREVFTSVALSASKELSRIFEYQIALIGEGMSLDALARFAVECSLNHIGRKRLLLHGNSIVEGALFGRPRSSDPTLTLSVLIGDKELKWKLGEILSKPALRREILLFQDNIPNVLPWEFLAKDESDPMLYGYRSIMLERDFANEVFRIHKYEEHFVNKVPWDPDDFHRHYLPRKRLIGDDVIEKFKSFNSDSNVQMTLSGHVTTLCGRKYMADDVEIVYRSFRRKQEMFADPRLSTLNSDHVVSDGQKENRPSTSGVLPEIVCSQSPPPPISPVSPLPAIKRRPSMAVIKFALTPTHCPTFKNDNEHYLTSQQLNMVELKDLMSTNKISTSVEDSATRSLSADESSSGTSICESRDSFVSGNLDFKSSLAASCTSNSNAIFGAFHRLHKSLDETCPRHESKGNATARSFTFSDAVHSIFS